MYCVALALVSMFTAARIPSSGSAAGQRRILFIYIAIETLSRTFHFCFFVDVFYFFFFRSYFASRLRDSAIVVGALIFLSVVAIYSRLVAAIAHKFVCAGLNSSSLHFVAFLLLLYIFRNLSRSPYFNKTRLQKMQIFIWSRVLNECTSRVLACSICALARFSSIIIQFECIGRPP